MTESTHAGIDDKHLHLLASERYQIGLAEAVAAIEITEKLHVGVLANLGKGHDETELVDVSAHGMETFADVHFGTIDPELIDDLLNDAEGPTERPNVYLCDTVRVELKSHSDLPSAHQHAVLTIHTHAHTENYMECLENSVARSHPDFSRLTTIDADFVPDESPAYANLNALLHPFSDVTPEDITSAKS